MPTCSAGQPINWLVGIINRLVCKTARPTNPHIEKSIIYIRESIGTDLACGLHSCRAAAEQTKANDGEMAQSNQSQGTGKPRASEVTPNEEEI